MTFGVAQRAVVVDASAAVPFLRADPAWVERWSGWIRAGAMVLAPAHFGHEVANALVRGTPSGELEAFALIGALFRSGFEVADRGLAGLEGSIRLAERHRLTIYDAAYLDLALDVEGELATLDDALRSAAIAEGVSVVG